MNKIHKCKCGRDLDKSLGCIVIKDNRHTGGLLDKVWEYRCPDCLQGYYQYLPEDIEIKND